MHDLKIRPILDQVMAAKVMKAAQDNHHLLIQPTHYVAKGEEIIGGFNLCKMPVCQYWMDSEKAQIRDSLVSINVAENIARATGQQILVLLSKPESPFSSLIGRLGYAQLDTMTLNYKLLNNET